MFDPQFEYNGKLFDVETLQAAADDKGMSYEDFLAEMKAKGLKEINPEPTFVDTNTAEEEAKLSEYQQATQLSADQQKEIDDLYGTEDNPNLNAFFEIPKVPIFSFDAPVPGGSNPISK